MTTLRLPRRPPVGARPGTLHIPHDAPAPVLRACRFDTANLDELAIPDVAALRTVGEAGRTLWVDVQGLGDLEVIEALGSVFHLHPLVLEDLVHVPQRPKVDDYADHVLLVTRMIRIVDESLDVEQVAIVLGEDFVLSVQERPGDVLDPVRHRLRTPGSKMRHSGPDYLAYAILDTIVDAYFPVMEDVGEALESLEDQVLSGSSIDVVSELAQARRVLTQLRRAMWPQRDALAKLLREPHPLLTADLRVYLRDTQDHTVQLVDLLESQRELVNGLMNTHLTVVSNRMNEVMKVLTIMASIFIPVTFLAGLYGMNFDYMPELHYRFAYPVLLLVMAVVTAIMLVYFRWRGWLGARESEGVGLFEKE